MVRGNGFLNIDNSSVTIGALPVSQIDIISNTEMHLVPDAALFAKANSYPINLTSLTNLNLNGAELKVIEPHNYTEEYIDTNNYTSNLLHDPTRSALFYIERGATIYDTSIVKLSFDAVNGWTKSSLDIQNLAALSDTINNSELIATSYTPNNVYHIDPDSLTITKTVVNWGSSDGRYNYIKQVNDGLTVITDRFDHYYTYPKHNDIDLGTLSGPVQILSGNRDTLINGPRGTSTASYTIFAFDASDRSIAEIDSFNLHPRRIGISDWGERIVLMSKVYDSSYSYLGDLAIPDVWSNPFSIAVSPDGSKVYTVLFGRTIITYNLSGNTGPFSVLGTPTNIAVAAEGDQVSPADMIISQDGGTLFISFHVVPQFNFPDYYKLAVLPVPN